MNSTASAAYPRTAEQVRVGCFALLHAASAVAGTIAGATPQCGGIAGMLWLTASVPWVVSDLRVRGVAGLAFAVQLLLALVPFWGLSAYLVWSRRVVGLLEWLVFVVAVYVPAGLAAVLAHGITQFARGEPW
jgi:hypothetical protein